MKTANCCFSPAAAWWRSPVCQHSWCIRGNDQHVDRFGVSHWFCACYLYIYWTDCGRAGVPEWLLEAFWGSVSWNKLIRVGLQPNLRGWGRCIHRLRRSKRRRLWSPYRQRTKILHCTAFNWARGDCVTLGMGWQGRAKWMVTDLLTLESLRADWPFTAQWSIYVPAV